MTGIKVCGLTEHAGIEAALALQVERIGLVFAPSSPRLLTINTASQLAQIARGKAAIVAVLVNPGDKLLARIVREIAPDFLQLHGSERPDRVRTIWNRYHIPVIKAFSVANAKDIKDAERYARTAAEFLFDAKPPKDATRAGGFGTSFHWELLADVKPARPWLLAGGLTPDNVATAIAVTGAPMVDVSSGVESTAGVKDPTLLAQFCAAARSNGSS